MESKVYNQTGNEVGTVKLPESVFGLPWNTKTEHLVHQVVVSMAGNKRNPTAHTKNRGEVSGTGDKPWRQKGTGRARHGSRRSPIWVGGGIAHGPRNERDYSRKINKKMKAKALFAVLSSKFKDGEIIFLDNISMKSPKTKDAKEVLGAISKINNSNLISKKKNSAMIALHSKDENVVKSFNNFGNLEVGQAKDLNVLDLMQYKYLVVTEPEKAIEMLKSKTSNKK